MSDDNSDNSKKGLRPLSRRSFLVQVAGGATLLGVGGCATTGAPYTGATDSDSGPYADAAGYGVRGGHRACTDSDVGSYADPANQGRSCHQQSGLTDNDTGPYADPAGAGRGSRRGGGSRPPQSGYTDNDRGQYADPAGAGRGGGRPQTGYTDNDQGQYADPAGAGRGGARACSDSDTGRHADHPSARHRNLTIIRSIHHV